MEKLQYNHTCIKFFWTPVAKISPQSEQEENFFLFNLIYMKQTFSMGGQE